MSASGDSVPRHTFVTIKVTARFRRWLKEEAARRELPMYEALEALIDPDADKLPWRASA